MTLAHKVLLGIEIYLAAATGLVIVSCLFRLWHKVRGKSDTTAMSRGNIALAMERSNHESRIHHWLDALDIFLNVTFMNGQNDETMSSHAWRAATAGHWWGIAMNWWLEGFQPHHGYQAACGDLQRAINRAIIMRKALGIE